MNIRKILDNVIGISLYTLVFFIPFSKSGIEICATIAIIAWIIKRGIRIKDYGLWIMGYGVWGKGYGIWREVFPRTPLNKPIATLFVISLVSIVSSVNLNLSLEGIFLKLGEYLLLFYIALDFFSEKNHADKRIKILFNIIIISVLIIFTDAVFQWITGKDFLRGHMMKRRLQASFGTPNGFAAWLIVVIPLLWAMALSNLKRTKISNAFKPFLFILSLFGLVLLGMTFSRGAWLGFLVAVSLTGFFTFFIKRQPVRVFSFTAIICLITFFALGIFVFKPIEKRLLTVTKGFEEAGFKKYVWREALNIIEDFPILGTGPNTYAYVAPNYKLIEETGHYPHNSYLQMAAETGLLGLGAFLWVLWRFFSLALKKVKKTGDLLLLGIASGLVAFLTQSFFDTNLYALQLIVLFWIMLGVGAARIARPDSDN